MKHDTKTIIFEASFLYKFGPHPGQVVLSPVVYVLGSVRMLQSSSIQPNTFCQHTSLIFIKIFASKWVLSLNKSIIEKLFLSWHWKWLLPHVVTMLVHLLYSRAFALKSSSSWVFKIQFQFTWRRSYKINSVLKKNKLVLNSLSVCYFNIDNNKQVV